MKFTDDSQNAWVSECAEYIRQKQTQDQEFERRDVQDGEAFPLRTATKDRLTDALKKAESLESALYPLLMQAKDLPFDGMEKLISDAFRGASDTVMACKLALSDSLPRPGDRRLQYRYHHIAVTLAAAYFPEPKRKETLELAIKIIQASGLDDGYSTEAAHKWWSEYRKSEKDSK